MSMPKRRTEGKQIPLFFSLALEETEGQDPPHQGRTLEAHSLRRIMRREVSERESGILEGNEVLA